MREILQMILKPQFVFLVLEMTFGLLFVFTTPPAVVGDEPHHFYRAWQLSEGQIIGKKHENTSGGWIPESILATNKKLAGKIEMNQDEKFDTSLISELRSVPLEPKKQIFARFPNTVIYAPVPYLPQITGISIGKVFGASPLIMIYLARIANLFCFCALTFWAIRIIPVHKWVLCLLALTPTSVFQVSSVSVDAFTYGICFLTIALYFFYGLSDLEKLSGADVLLIGVISLLAVLSKQAYILLPLLFFLIPRRRIGSTGKYLLTFSSLAAPCLLASAAWSLAVKPIYAPYRNNILIDPDQQAKFIINNPVTFLFNTFSEYLFSLGYYVKTFFGQLTWLDLYAPTYLIIFNCALIIAFAALDKDAQKTLSKFHKFLFATIFIGTAVIVSALLYMTWSPIGGNEIEGIQGRYFIPVAPLFFLLFYQHIINWRYFARLAPYIIYAAVTFSLIITLSTVINRYYI